MDLILNLPPLSSDTAAAPWWGEDILCHRALALPPLLLIRMFSVCSFSLSSCALPPANFSKDIVGFSHSSRDHLQVEEAKGVLLELNPIVTPLFYSILVGMLFYRIFYSILFAAPAHCERWDLCAGDRPVPVREQQWGHRRSPRLPVFPHAPGGRLPAQGRAAHVRGELLQGKARLWTTV